MPPKRSLVNPTTWGSEIRKTVLFCALLALGIYGIVTHQDVLGGITALVGVLQMGLD